MQSFQRKRKEALDRYLYEYEVRALKEDRIARENYIREHGEDVVDNKAEDEIDWNIVWLY